MDALLPFHWWIKVMYFIYWRKLILKATFCYPQQRFIHRIILWTLLVSKSFGNILKLQSTFTDIKTSEGLELQPACFRRQCGFSLSRHCMQFNILILPESYQCPGIKGVCWFCERLQMLLTFCLFSCIEFANGSSSLFILVKQCCRNVLRPRMIVQCHWWSTELQVKGLKLCFLLGFCFWMDVCSHLCYL